MNGATGAPIAEFVRERIPSGGGFAGMEWKIATTPFQITARTAREIDSLGRVILQFYRAINLAYRKSFEGKAPTWIMTYLDQGKPSELVELQRHRKFKNDIPRVIRPDVFLADDGLKISELDSVPGGIGLTAWLNKTYSAAGNAFGQQWHLVGDATSMQEGFSSIFGSAQNVAIPVSKESETYAPEMEWLSSQITDRKLRVTGTSNTDIAGADAIYRFFELFDIRNIDAWGSIIEKAVSGSVTVTAPPKPIFEEKLLFALLWNRNLRELWRQELGDSFLKRLLEVVPYSWIVDPTPIPPHAAIPELNITDWSQLKSFSQKERDLILKISGFAETAWGSRGVFLGSDMPSTEWAVAVDQAIKEFPQHPYILQRYHKPALHSIEYWNAEQGTVARMDGRVRLCPYYFVSGEGDQMKARLCGILATICPPDKKIIHGMTDAVLAPVCISPEIPS